MGKTRSSSRIAQNERNGAAADPSPSSSTATTANLFCANCLINCTESNDDGVQWIDVYNPQLEAYEETWILDALGLIFNYTEESDPSTNNNANLCLCSSCKNLYTDLLESYHNFMFATTLGSFVYNLTTTSKFQIQSIRNTTLIKAEAENEHFQFQPDESMNHESRKSDDIQQVVEQKLTTEYLDLEMKQEYEELIDEPKKSISSSRFKKIRSPKVKTNLTANKYKRKGKSNDIEPKAKKSPGGKIPKQSIVKKTRSLGQHHSSAPVPSSADEPGQPSTQYKCVDCPTEEFLTILLWRAHQQNIHKRYFPRKAVRVHKHRKNNKPYQCNVNYQPCPICGTGCFGSITYHMSKAHPKLEEQRPACPICGFTSRNKWGLTSHMKRRHDDNSETQTYFCSICFLGLKSIGNLKNHEALHRGELNQNLKWECEVCKEKFYTKFKLEKHKTKHTEDRPCICEHCGKGFKSKQQLKQHILRIHDPERKKDKKCDVCEKAFSVPSRVKDHLIGVHKLSVEEAIRRSQIRTPVIRLLDKDAKEYEDKLKERSKPSPICDLCGKKYSRREYLTTHLINAHNISKEHAFKTTGLQTVRELPGTGLGGSSSSKVFKPENENVQEF